MRLGGDARERAGRVDGRGCGVMGEDVGGDWGV